MSSWPHTPLREYWGSAAIEQNKRPDDGRSRCSSYGQTNAPVTNGLQCPPRSTRLERALSHAKHKATYDIQNGNANKRELDCRAHCGKRRSETATAASKRTQKGNVFTRVERRGGKREERHDNTGDSKAPPAARPGCVADRQARQTKEQPVGDHVAGVEDER